MKKPWLILAVAVVATFLAMLDNSILVIAIPALRTDLGLSIEQVQWVVEGYVLSFASLVVLGGSLADRLGPKYVFVSGVLLFTTGSLISGMALSSGPLIAGRVVAGVGTALMIPAGIALVAKTFTGPSRGTALGIWAATSGVAICIGPIIGGVIMETWSWHGIFLINIPIGIGLAIAACLLIPNWRPEERRLPNLVSSLLLALCTFTLFFSVIETSKLSHAGLTGLVLVAIVSGGIFCYRELTASEPVIDLKLLRIPTMAVIVAVAALLYFALMPLNLYMSVYLQIGQGRSATEAALIMLPWALVVVVTAPFAGRLASRIGSTSVMLAGMTAGAAGAVIICVSLSGSLVGLIAGECLIGLAVAMTISPISVGVLRVVPKHRQAVATGMTTAIRELGGALGVALTSALFVVVATGNSPAAGLALENGTSVQDSQPAIDALTIAATWVFAVAGVAFAVGAIVIAVSQWQRSRCDASSQSHAAV